MNGVSDTPVPIMASANSIMRVTPYLFISAAANGPIAPYSRIEMPIASEIVERGQPNSVSSGTTRMPGLARTPATTRMVVNVTAATIQA